MSPAVATGAAAAVEAGFGDGLQEMSPCKDTCLPLRGSSSISTFGTLNNLDLLMSHWAALG